MVNKNKSFNFIKAPHILICIYFTFLEMQIHKKKKSHFLQNKVSIKIFY
jgi:hypothetical protein